jgi:hypothetical protein
MSNEPIPLCSRSSAEEVTAFLRVAFNTVATCECSVAELVQLSADSGDWLALMEALALTVQQGLKFKMSLRKMMKSPAKASRPAPCTTPKSMSPFHHKAKEGTPDNFLQKDGVRR